MVDVTVNVDGVELPPGREEFLTGILARAAEAALRHQAVTDGELSITLVTDAGIATLNRQYLGRDRPTDVIAFSLGDPQGPLVGDVYIGFDEAARQAAGVGVPLEDELARLAVHGTLHVLGFDHPEDERRERSAMWALQEQILVRLQKE